MDEEVLSLERGETTRLTVTVTLQDADGAAWPVQIVSAREVDENEYYGL